MGARYVVFLMMVVGLNLAVDAFPTDPALEFGTDRQVYSDSYCTSQLTYALRLLDLYGYYENVSQDSYDYCFTTLKSYCPNQTELIIQVCRRVDIRRAGRK